MTIIWNETQTPIHPGEVSQVHLIVTYTVARGALGRMLLRFLEGRPFPLRLSIGDKPDWCTAQLTVENFIGVITPDEIQTVNSVLFIQLSEDAPPQLYAWICEAPWCYRRHERTIQHTDSYPWV